MIDIQFTSDPLQPDFRGTLEDFRQRFLLNLKGTISETQVLIGQVGGAKPVYNIGPWLNTDTWYIWNGSDYVPSTIKVGGATYHVTLSNEFAGTPAIVPSKVQVLQDKSGTIALTSDVYEGRPTKILSGATPEVDWSVAENFFLLLSVNATITSVNSKDGQEIAIVIRNAATTYTVTWPTYIAWAAGTPPTQSVTNKSDLIILKNIGGSVIGRVSQAYP